MLSYDSEFDRDPELEEIEAEAREGTADAIQEEFDRHADYEWDDPYPYEEYAEYEGDEGVKPEEGDNICKKCDGTGEFPEDHLCKACAGKGRIDEVQEPKRKV